ncbi:MAG TPA: S16 family serine protease, partial [Bdellovibrionales bacterium]|nr:S16 family serine protease [Bdellovibrionales bacterium]
VIIPKENEKDVKDIPKEVLKDLKIILVDHVDQVLVNALDIKNPKDLFKNKLDRDMGLKANYTGHELQAH